LITLLPTIGEKEYNRLQTILLEIIGGRKYSILQTVGEKEYNRLKTILLHTIGGRKYSKL